MDNVQTNWLQNTYRAKPGSDMSVTDLCRPSYQLWVKLNLPDSFKPSPYVGFKSYLGSALHNFVEGIDEDSTIKEFTHLRKHGNTVIGGTTDELRWNNATSKWRIGDIKLKGAYPTKKFLGIGTKANPNPPAEQDKEVLQQSMYRWLFQGLFDIEDEGVIYLFTAGHSAREQFPEMQTVPLQLMSIDSTDKYIQNKLLAVQSEPEVDCETSWLCGYCDYKDYCPFMNHKAGEGFSDESKS